MKERRLSVLWLIVLALLGLAAGLRLVDLGWAPLSDLEAGAALAAAAGTPAQSPFWSIEAVGPFTAAYTTLTAGLFALLGGSDALARLVPALAGVGVAALPLLLAGRIGWTAAIGGSAALAISTAALFVSRTAGGAALAALAVGLLVVAAIRQRDDALRVSMSGLGLGLAASAGPEMWMGLFGLALGLSLWRLFSPSAAVADWIRDAGQSLLGRKSLALAVLVLLLFGAGFGTRTSAFGSVLAAPGAWFEGWLQGGGLDLLFGLRLVVDYEPLLVFATLMAVVFAARSSRPERQLFFYWTMGALLAFALYPGRSGEHLVWFALPASVLVGFALEAALERWWRPDPGRASALLLAFLLVLAAFGYLLVRQAASGLGLPQLTGSSQVLFGVAAVVFIVTMLLLFGVGWSWQETGLVLLTFALMASTAMTLAAGWKVNHRAEASAHGQWRRPATSLNMELLDETLQALSSAELGREGGLRLALASEPTPALAWALRDYEPAPLTAAEGTPPPVILAIEGQEPVLPADYLGQALALYEIQVGWETRPGQIGLTWLGRRPALERRRWVLYVRTDVAGLGDESGSPTGAGN